MQLSLFFWLVCDTASLTRWFIAHPTALPSQFSPLEYTHLSTAYSQRCSLCFLAGANSIFTRDSLTNLNYNLNADQLFFFFFFFADQLMFKILGINPRPPGFSQVDSESVNSVAQLNRMLQRVYQLPLIRLCVFETPRSLALFSM